MSRIMAIHLLNDRSGSPMVFREALAVLGATQKIHLFTSHIHGNGFLSEMPEVQYHQVYYGHHRQSWRTLLHFLWSQFLLFFQLLLMLRSRDTVYVNTLLPFGAAWAGRLRGCRIVYHVHETSIRPALFRRLLVYTAERTADTVLFVSRFVASRFQFPEYKTQIIYNCLSADFTERSHMLPQLKTRKPFTVLMLCSLKLYKGPDRFVALARALPQLHFELVLNATEDAVRAFTHEYSIPDNCSVYTTQTDTIPFYARAHVVLNLSDPGCWLETFGLTLLEAMHCGRPVICPEEGGVLELVQDGKEGFTINPHKTERLYHTLQQLSQNEEQYRASALAARERALTFDRGRFQAGLQAVFAVQQFPEWKNAADFFPEMENQQRA